MANNEKSLRDILTTRLIETITNTEDGAGSDLQHAEWTGDEWIEVDGALDIQHVVSEVLQVLEEQNVFRSRRLTSEEYLASYGDTGLEV